MGIIVRPFVALALFFAAALIARAIMRHVKSPTLRKFLLRPMRIIPRTEAERRDLLPVILLWSFTAILFVSIWLADPLRH